MVAVREDRAEAIHLLLQSGAALDLQNMVRDATHLASECEQLVFRMTLTFPLVFESRRTLQYVQCPVPVT